MSNETDPKAAPATVPLPATANPDNLYWVMSEAKFMYLPTRTLFERAAVVRQVGEKVALLIEREKVCSNLFWAPGMPTLMENKACIDGALFDEPGNNLLNTYKPPPKVKGDPAKADFWRNSVASFCRKATSSD